MPNPTPKKLTRRDAIKILSAAAGASVLANLPSKWSMPELTSGVLPAHAATSGPSVGPYSIFNCDHFFSIFSIPGQNPPYAGGPAEIYVNPGVLGLSMHYKVEIIPTAGTASSNVGESDFLINNLLGLAPFIGYGYVYVEVNAVSYNGLGKSQGAVRVTWTFTNDPADGTGSCVSETAYDLDEPTPP